MKIFSSLHEIKNIDNTVVALGNFDGIHLGHQELIKKTKEIAEAKGYKTAVFSFSNHPLNMIKGIETIQNISIIDEKINILENFNIDYFFNIKFDEEVMKLEPDDFIKEFIVKNFKAKGLVCGFNYRFGYKAKGTLDLLKKMGQKYDFTVDVIDPVIVNGDVVSSTLIRGLIKSGDVIDVKDYLGRNFDIEGEVVVGNKIGRTIGFPTSNISINKSIVTPPNGVYVTNCIYNNESYPSITNVGTRPTIGKFEKNIETHIFNFNSELYEKIIRVEFLTKLRDEVKFNDVNQLKRQIIKDCKDAKEWHESNNVNIFEIIS